MFLRSITLTNFGPYKGEQKIELPPDAGVTVVYGENMRGKTTLLNAIRYALFGKVITRGDRQIDLHQIGNWEAAEEEGKYGFKVVLAFTHNNSEYELTRECRPRPGVTIPQTDLDYQQNWFLRKDGDVLGPDQGAAELARIMPEAVSRFFLFDGELLQQYEELLRDESEMGRKIKEAIERILGLPILTNGRADLTQALNDAQGRESKAAQRNLKTQTLGNQHGALLSQRDGLQREIDALATQLEEAKASKAAKEEQLSKVQRARAQLDERARIQDDIASIEERLREKDARRTELLADAWKLLLSRRLQATRATLQQTLDTLQDRYRRELVSAEVIEKLTQSVDAGECQTCGQTLSDSARERLSAAISKWGGEQRSQLDDEIQNIQNRIYALSKIETSGDIEALEDVQRDIDDLKVRRSRAQDRLSDIKEQVKGLDEAELRRLWTEFEQTVARIDILQNGVSKEQTTLATVEERIARVEAEMAKYADAELDEARVRKDLCERLKLLFAVAVNAYRDRLREKVEADASRLFLELTSEPDYAGLRINDNYGLAIVHRDGTTIPVRSAGAEHVVALSLMGALQRNAPLRGPIVMDSPVGRLDETHTTNVVEALPNMAEQVMLLVYEAELNPETAREKLKGMLRREYFIRRRTARHSELELLR